MTDWNAVSAFMANVVPWPGSAQDPGFINLHYSSVNRKNPNGPLLKGMGWPFRGVDGIVGRASWINSTTQFKDAWFCLSLQSSTKPNTKDPSKPKAHRLAANALALKAVWLDIDVEPGNPKKYDTVEEALKAVLEFKDRAGLPMFSAVVGSGSGLHVYWISDTAMPKAEWFEYADGLKSLVINGGLKCDAGLTTDAARILRVPGTFNHKTTPPKLVTLFNMPLVMLNFATQMAFLKAHSTQAAADTPADGYSPFVDPNVKWGKPAFTVTDGSTLGAGIGRTDDVKLDPGPIFKQCKFYRDALLTGGKDYDNALWMYSILGATFMENGNEIAHSISKGHATYSADDTQALYDRKVADRADRGIGYPSCSTIQGAGCKACASCPLLKNGKSPLNIRPTVTATVNRAALNMAAPLNQTQAARDLFLPAGYDVNPEGYICEVEEQQAGDEVLPPKYHQLFHSKLSNPWAQRNPDCLNVTTTVDLGTVHAASIKMHEMVGMGLGAVLLKEKIKPYPRNKHKLEHFLVSWIANLHALGAATASLPFGWYKEKGKFKGFVYNGILMKDDGSEHPCGVGDGKLREIYHVNGSKPEWTAACELITGQRRPELDAIVALSFAAPLTALIGLNGTTLCCYGDSAAGKSSAYAVGISVWGHSKRGKMVSHSTFNQVMRTMGELSNLPLYWDEIKEAKEQAAVFEFMYNSTEGVEKGRLKSDISQQDRGVWQTQMMLAANVSYVDYVISKNSNHVAGVSRVLEYNIKKIDTGPGRISPTDANVMFDKLQDNYGHLGLEYAKLLAMNHATINAEAQARCKQVEIDMEATVEERLWVGQVGTLIYGAELANQLGCDFDVDGLKKFMYRVYQENRDKRNSMIEQTGYKDSTEGIMSAFFAQIAANDQMLWTDSMPKGPGRAANLILYGPQDTRNTAVEQKVAVRWIVSDRTLYIEQKTLVNFLTTTKKGSVSSIMQSLTKDYGMELIRKTRIGGGTSYDIGRQSIFVFKNIHDDHEWAPLLYNKSPEKKYDAPPPPQGSPPKTEKKPETEKPVETGFEGLKVDETTGLASADSVAAFVRGAARG